MPRPIGDSKKQGCCRYGILTSIIRVVTRGIFIRPQNCGVSGSPGLRRPRQMPPSPWLNGHDQETASSRSSMPNWEYILNCLNAYRSAEIDQRISPKDGMNDKWYFQAGKSAVESIALACLASEVQEIRKVCDLPCGYGRVLRHLVQLFPQADFYACDLDAEGVDFCKTTFGARPMYSRAELTEMDLGAGYDLIWVG